MQTILLTLMFSLFVFTAMVDPEDEACTAPGKLGRAPYMCTLTDNDGGAVGSGCYVFDDVPVDGLLSSELNITSPDGLLIVKSTWKCGCNPLEPEEGVLCDGLGPANFPFTANAGGTVHGDTLVLGTLGITILPGDGGIAVCIKDPQLPTGVT